MEQLITRTDEHVGDGVFDSIAWAFSEHVGTVDNPLFQSAVMHGHNEDSPEKIEFYTQAEPLVTDKPAFVWESSKENEDSL